jgi:hypothetical protein
MRCGGEEKNSQPLPGLEPSFIQPVAERYTTELSRFLFNSYFQLKTLQQRVSTWYQLSSI